MNTLLRRATAIGTVLCSAMGVALAAELSAADLLREIQRTGSREVLRKYYDTPLWSSAIVPGIKAAQDDWLKVAEQLQIGADAGGAEDLDLALYAALPLRPFPVLHVLRKKYKRSPSYLCNVSFEAEIPEGGALPYLERVRQALETAGTTEEKAIATACRRGLEQSRAAALKQGLR